MKKAIFALGCFWKPEENFSKLNGIINTEVGYCGGNADKTPMKMYGETNHAEVVNKFDEKISYEKLVEKFFETTTNHTNMQGPDVGTQYRSEIFFLMMSKKNCRKS